MGCMRRRDEFLKWDEGAMGRNSMMKRQTNIVF